MTRRVHVSQHLAGPHGAATPRPAADHPSHDDAESSGDPSPVAPDPGEAVRALLLALWRERLTLAVLWACVWLTVVTVQVMAQWGSPEATWVWTVVLRQEL